MPTPPFDVEHQLQHHGRALRRLAGELVADTHAADDAVQDVWLAALERPPRHAQSLGGWLATALHHVVGGWRRKERRRALHESVAAAQRGDVDAGDGPAREARARDLLTAVEALDAPYRDVVWQRFFEGRPPRAIARASGVPTETVKSQLKRALGRLRDRLGKDGARDGRDWRAALVATFALHEGKAVALATGGVLVATWTKIAAAAAAGALAAFLWWPRGAVAPIGDAARATGAPAATLAAATNVPATTPAAAEAPSPPAPSAERLAVAVAPPPEPELATIRGRCVDAAGLPLAGAAVKLTGWPRADEDMTAHVAQRARPEWRDPAPQTTGSDGRFEMRFAPPAPFQFWSEATRVGCVPRSAHWLRIAAGSVLDVGDVPLLPGAFVRGRVVDGAGRARADVQVCLEEEPFVGIHDRGAFAPSGVQPPRRSAADGTFAFPVAVPAGTYSVGLLDALVRLRAPVSCTIEVGRDVDVTLVVDDLPAERMIRGRVLDGADAPIADAMVAWASERTGTGHRVSTARDGSFTVHATDAVLDHPVQLVVTAVGFEPPPPLRGIAWGRTDVVVRLLPAGDLLVRAVDLEGEPVTEFSVRVFEHGAGKSAPETKDLRITGPNAAGVLALGGIQRGSYGVVVEFPAATGFVPHVALVVYAGGVQNVDVRAELPVHRTLRVVGSDGRAVVGTRVQLCEMLGDTWRETTKVLPRPEWFSAATWWKALVVQDTRTDADGRCELSGPTQRTLGVRVLGPGHVPHVLDGVHLGDAQELVVAVATGGTVRGRIVPPEATAELARLQRAAADAGLEVRGARIRLRQGTSSFPPVLAHEDDPAVVASAIAADGSFALAGVPPGEWQVSAQTFHVNEFTGVGRSGQGRSTQGPRVSVRDGEVVDVEFDLTALLPGRLVGTVLTNGRPLANAWIVLESVTPAGPGRPRSSDWRNLRTDAQGRFEHIGPAGTFDLLQCSGSELENCTVYLLAREAVTTRGLVTTEQTFTISSGMLELAVLDASGQPAPGVAISIARPRNVLAPTDRAGRVTAEVTAGPNALRVHPRSLQSFAARSKLVSDANARGQAADPDAHWLDLGEVVVVAGETTRHTVRLPADWATK